MGYRAQRKQFRILFDDDHEYHGLEVVVRSLSIGRFLQVAEQFDAVDVADASSVKLGDIRDLVDVFAESIIGWNLEDEDGVSVPATTDGLLRQDVPLVATLLRQWGEGMAGVPKSLGKGSGSGVPSQVASLPMGPSSRSQAS